MQVKKIVLFKLRNPGGGINKELQFVANSLGLFSLRDKEKSMFRIFIELVKNAKSGKPVSSDELAYQLNLTRGTVVHHLRKLIMADIAQKKARGYALKEEHLQDVIKKIKDESCAILDELERIAKDIDSKI